MRGDHRAFLPAWHLTEMRAAEIDPAFGLIEQAVRVVVGGGVAPMNPGAEIVRDLMPIDRETRSQIGAMTRMQPVYGAARHLDLPGHRQGLESFRRLSRDIRTENYATRRLEVTFPDTTPLRYPRCRTISPP